MNDQQQNVEPEQADPSGPQPDAVDSGRRRLVTWLWRLPVIAVLLGGIYGVYEASKVIFGRVRPDTLPRFVRGERVEVAALSDLANIWDSSDFVYEDTPAIVVRIPQPAPGSLTLDVSEEGGHFIAFSRICTHQGCLVSLNKNTELIAISYNYRSRDPALACSCHFSVFAPSRAGQAMSGPATTPLPRIRLEASRRTLYATGIEETSS